MGLDLRILPQYSRKCDFSLDIIELHRESNLFEIIDDLEKDKGKEVPREGISSFTGENDKYEGLCYGNTIETAYGDIMKGVMADELKNVLANYKTKSWKNRAFIAFLNEMPDDLEIWLYWH